MPSPHFTLPGDGIVAERYRLEEEIGRGGASTVYLAEDLKFGRKVAIKVLRPVPGYEPQRFLREIRIAARLSHPQILPLHDSGEIEPERPDAPRLLYFVMPYAGCESLRARLIREGQLPVPGSATRTVSASSTGTSSRKTSCSWKASRSSPTSASPPRFRRRAGTPCTSPIMASPSALPPT